MAHYPYCFAISRLQLAVHMGWEAPERKKPQPVEVTIRLYFPEKPICMSDDDASFIDYDGLCNGIHALVEKNQFRLIEYMSNVVFAFVRDYVNKKNAPDVAVWLSLTKVAAPVPHLLGGAGFVLSDLPANATTIAVQ